MNNSKKRSRRSEGKKSVAEQDAIMATSGQPRTEEPAAIPAERATPRMSGLTPVELCALAMSGATLLAVLILSWSISEKLRQIGEAKQADRLIAQVSRVSTSLEEGLRQNRSALDAILSASRLDQRAWVGVKSIQMFPMEAGKPLKMEVKIGNSGKTFALDLRHTGILHLSETPLADVAPADRENLDKQPKQVPTLVTLAPNGESLIPCASVAPITEEMIAGINAGKIHVYLVGEISYTDIFKQWHSTRFFQHYVPAGQKFMAEQAHNDAD